MNNLQNSQIFALGESLFLCTSLGTHIYTKDLNGRKWQTKGLLLEKSLTGVIF